jgi:hypothetical protein
VLAQAWQVPGTEQADGGGSPLERALVSLLSVAPGMKAGELGPAVEEAARHLGGRSTVVLLVDLGQRALYPIGDHHDEGAGPTSVDGSLAGEAFRSESPVQQRTAEGTRLWVPILDSAERVGVLGTTLDQVSPLTERHWAVLAGLVGELVVTKSRYGDALVVARRPEPLTLAAEMRWALLPPLTFTSTDVVISAILEPAYQVAGDVFDYAVNGSLAHVALFDAMGHGLEASRMANLAVGSYRHSRRRGEDLGECVRAMDAAIEEQFGDSRFVTGHVATLDLDSGVLYAINAGHPPGVVFHDDGSTDELRCARVLPLGLGASPSEATWTQLREGDVILFHTDGITEARSAGDDFFGSERLERLVSELLAARLRPPEVLRRVLADILSFQPRLRDDATLLLLGWRLGEQSVPPTARL